MRTRRIFTPAYHPRRWGPLLAGILAAGAVAGLAVAVPRDIFGPAPREQVLTVPAAEVRVVDGETLRLGAHMLRLAGILAPERGRQCRDARGGSYDCGTAAAEVLARLVADRDVECRLQGQDRLGRPLGLCRAGGVEVNASLVAAGLALSGTGPGSSQLLPLEATARDGARGLWAASENAERLRRGGL